MKTEAYHNTTDLTGFELWEAEYKALKQDDAVLKVMKGSHLLCTPERVLLHLQILEPLTQRKWAKTPLTSVRRSFSNLQRKGLIEKTDEMTMGAFGKPVHKWKLV